MEEENNNPSQIKTKYTYYGLLNKLQQWKDSGNKMRKEIFVGIIKTSNDQEVSRLSEILMGSPSSNPIIGLRKSLRIIQLEDVISKIELLEYNYLLSKKFRYLKDEAIELSDILIIIVNIYNKKCIDNLKQIIEEITTTNTANKITEEQNNIDFSAPEEVLSKKLRFVLVKTTNNFLMKINEGTLLANMKNEIKGIVKKLKSADIKFIEIDIDEKKDSNILLNDLIN